MEIEEQCTMSMDTALVSFRKDLRTMVLMCEQMISQETIFENIIDLEQDTCIMNDLIKFNIGALILSA